MSPKAVINRKFCAVCGFNYTDAHKTDKGKLIQIRTSKGDPFAQNHTREEHEKRMNAVLTRQEEEVNYKMVLADLVNFGEKRGDDRFYPDVAGETVKLDPRGATPAALLGAAIEEITRLRGRK